MNIYIQELRMIRGSVLTWSVSLVGLLLVFMSMFGMVAEDAKILNEMMSQFPPELLMAFGMTGMNMATILGFYSMVFLMVQICLSIQSANYGFSLVSVEETEMTSDFLLAKPITRPYILTRKLLAVLTGLVITNAVVWVSTLGFITIFGRGEAFDRGTLLLLLSGIIIFQLTFLCLGLFISQLTRRMRSVTPYAMGLAFGAYVLSAFGGLLGDVKLELITPFKHFEASYVVTNGAYNLPLVLLSIVYIVVSLVAAYLLYTRRDIHSAV